MAMQPDEVYQHTSGSVAGFTPNMTQEQITALDRRRGMGDMGPYTNPDVIENKKPWLDAQGMHKADDEETEPTMSKTQEATQVLKGFMGGLPFGKPMPERRAGETVAERDVRHHMEHKDEHPGGAKQAIAIGLNQAREAGAKVPAKKSATSGEINKQVLTSAPPPAGSPALPHGSRVAPAGGGQSGMSPAQSVLSAVPRSSGPPPIPGVKSLPEEFLERVKDHKDDEDSDKAIGEKFFGKQCGEAEKSSVGGGVLPAPAPLAAAIGKALSTRSLFVPRPLGPYDPFGVERSALEIHVHGAAPREQAPILHPDQAYKSCVIHGITYRAENGCHPCNVQKSQTCSSCGGQLVKSFGGTLFCERCK